MAVKQGAVVVLLAALFLGAGPGRPAVAQAVSVVVDGRIVAFDQPPAVIGGRLLIPLRGVFERLGARVLWQPESRQVVARRGPTTILLQPGNRYAWVNGRAVTLDAPPLVLQGRVLVPLWFVSEALGADVDWDAATRTVSVTSSRPGALPPRPLPQPEPPPPAPAPAATPEPIDPPIRIPPPQPVPTVIEGTVARVDAHTVPPRLHVRTTATISSVVVRPETAIFVTETSTGRSGAAALDQIRRGDQVRVTLDAHLQAMMISASHREVIGRLEGVSARLIALAGGQGFRLAEEVLFLLDGREVTRDALRRGMELTLRMHPQTGEVWEVRARARPGS